MRSMDPNSTLVYRWLYTFLNNAGKEYYRAIGPWMRKQNVNHGREGYGAIKAELQQLEPMPFDRGYASLQWETIKTVELKNADS